MPGFGLDYDRLRRSAEKAESLRDRYLISFSDLFVLLAFVFMFLYVLSTIQSGILSLAQRHQNALARQEYGRKLEDTIRAYEQRLHAYEVEKVEYLEKHATAREVEVYQGVLNKLYLLREDAQAKNRRHLEIARKYDQKQKELEQYRNVIADIAKSNLVSKARMLKESAVKQQTEEKLETIQATFDERLSKASEEHKKKLEKEYAATLKKERQDLQRERVLLRDDYKEKVSAIKDDYRVKLQTVDKKNKTRLDELKVSYQTDIAKTKEQYKGKVAAVSGELTEVNSELKEARSDLKQTQAEKQKLEKEKTRALASVEKLRTDLEDVRNRQARVRAGIAGQLKAEFDKAGIAAEVNERTGEVTISFAEVYFDYDSAALKPEMKEAIRKVVPVYAKTILGAKDTRKQIASLEVVGFASPTYLGKYVEPGRLDWTGKRGVNYNMDLSYSRAKAIFEYIFDREQFRFGQQTSMLRMTKVAGVSYLKAEPPRKPASAETKVSPKAKDFCAQYDCRAWQKVILKFNLKEVP